MSKIGDIATLITKGTTPTTVGEGFTESGVNFVKVESIDNNGNIIPDYLQKISEQTHKKLKRSQLKEDDLLITIAGALGRTYVVRREILPANTNQAVGIIRVDPNKYSSHFLRYWIQTNWVQKTLGLANAQSIQKNLNLVNLGDINIPDVELTKQVDIVNLLSKLDHKIELNNKINAELEQMAKTLYDYWFVQFDFPDANSKPYKSSDGAMVYNEKLKREIPEGWKVGDIEQIGSIVGGSTPSTKESDNFTNDGISWITPDDLSDRKGLKFISKGKRDVTQKGLSEASLKKYPKGTVLLSSRAPIGYMAIAQNELTTNQGFKSIIPNKGYSTEFAYYAIKNYIKPIIQYSSGSTFTEISGTVLKMLVFCIPPKDISAKYTEDVTSIFEKQKTLEYENHKLAQLRDWLLTMLMNGQVTVK